MQYSPKFALQYREIMSALERAEEALKSGERNELPALYQALTRECAGRKYVLMHPDNKRRLESALEAIASLAPEAREPAVEKALIVPAAYGDLEWELKAPREGGNPKKDKILYTFDKHQERLEKEGRRGPFSSEVFSLLADGLEGKLQGAMKDVYDDMLSSYGEWLALAMKRKKDELIVYINPSGLIWDGNTYVENGFKCDGEQKYDIAGIPSRELVDLDRFKDDFVKGFYGRSFGKLPKEMREGGRRAQAYLPPEGVLWPVGRYYFVIRFYISGCYYGSRASRGVRAPQGAVASGGLRA